MQVLDLQTQKHILTSFLVYDQFWRHVFHKKSHFGLPPVLNDYKAERNYYERSRSPTRTNIVVAQEIIPTTNEKNTSSIAIPFAEDVIPIKKSTRQRLREVTRDIIQTYDYTSYLYNEAIRTKLTYRDTLRSCTNFLKNPNPQDLIVSSISILSVTAAAASIVATHIIDSVYIDQKSAFQQIVTSAGIDLPKTLVNTTIVLLQESFDIQKILDTETPEQLAINIVEVILFASQLSKMFGVSGLVDDLIVLTENENFNLDMITSLIVQKKETFIQMIGTKVQENSTSMVQQLSMDTIKNVTSGLFQKVSLGVQLLTKIQTMEDVKTNLIQGVNNIGEGIINNFPRPSDLQKIETCGLTSKLFGTCRESQEDLPLWAKRILLTGHVNTSHTATEIYNAAVYRVNNLTLPTFFDKLTGCVSAFVTEASRQIIKPVETAQVGMGEIADVFEIGLTLTTIWLIIGVIICIIMFGYIWWRSSKSVIKHAESSNIPTADVQRIEELHFGKFFRV
jgi:hypothetical protein